MLLTTSWSSQAPEFNSGVPTTQLRPKINPVQLRDIQQEVKKELYKLIAQGYQRNLVVAPCAFGKTVLAASIIYDASVIKNKNTLFVVPYISLIEQTYKTFESYGINTGIIAGDYKENRDCRVQIATIQTLSKGRDLSWFKTDIVLLDECHILAFSSWSKVNFPFLKDGKQVNKLNDLSNELKILGLTDSNCLTYNLVKNIYKQLAIANHPDKGGSTEAMQQINSAWETIKKHKNLFENITPTQSSSALLIGLTATPWRLSKKEEIGDIFEEQVLAPTPGTMVELGYLTPCIYYGIRGADLKGIRTTAGDFNLGELDVKCSDIEVVTSAVDNYLKICPDRLFLAFACTKSHAKLLMEEFNKRGIKTALITDNTPNKIRQILYEDLKRGTIKGLCSVDAIGIGFDVPEVSCILDCRPTKSKALYIQHLGRGQRLANFKKDCIVLDQAGNVKRHGFIEDVTYPRLRQATEKEKGAAPIKQCPDCEALIAISHPACPQCGYEFPITEKRKAVGEMTLIVKNKTPKLNTEEVPIYNFYRKKLKEAFSKKFSPGWAIFKTKEEFNLTRSIPRSWAKGAIFGDNPTERDRFSYFSHLVKVAKQKERTQQWVDYQMSAEFGSQYKKQLDLFELA